MGWLGKFNKETNKEKNWANPINISKLEVITGSIILDAWCCKDTEPFISFFYVLTCNTSFQYLSITCNLHAMHSLLVTIIC